MNLDKFTIKAQDALAVGQQIAGEYGNQQIEPEHIMMAMLRDEEGIIPTILKKAGLNLPALEKSIEYEISRLPKVQGGGLT
jgi:ATP-dependent Clp protease ATP-binding subunit ClpB